MENRPLHGTSAASEFPQLVVVCGLPGVGKSTVAHTVAERLGAEVLRTDAVRKELFDDPQYTDAETDAVYDELLLRARKRLQSAEQVVLDATFKSRARRKDARELAADAEAAFHLIRVDCDADTVERRIATRDDISDADFDIHLEFKERFERIEMDHIRIDNSGDESETVAQVEREF